MKDTMRRVAFSGALLATLVAALSQVSRPAEIRAQEGEECGPDDEHLCAVEHTRTCWFWIFFCSTTTEHIYYSDAPH